MHFLLTKFELYLPDGIRIRAEVSGDPDPDTTVRNNRIRENQPVSGSKLSKFTLNFLKYIFHYNRDIINKNIRQQFQ